MELKINLATASLKDAEHAIFLIGAYFGMTNLPTAPVVSGGHSVEQLRALVTPTAAGGVNIAGPSAALPPVAAAAVVAAAKVAPSPTAHLSAHEDAASTGNDLDPAATFAAHPAALPPGAGETPMTADPAAVFAGNAATVPVTPLATPGAGPSATPAAGPAVGDVGNVAGGVAGQVGSPSVVTTPPVPSLSPATPAGVVVDSTGLPWDARIHSSGEGGTKPQTADGKWRKKRNVQPLQVSEVERELRATMAAGTPAATPMPPQPPAATVTPPAMPQPPKAAPSTFEQLMPRITDAVLAGTLPQGALLQAVMAYALPNIPALSQRPDLVPSVWTYLQSMYPALV